jgi:HNH endonuclease
MTPCIDHGGTVKRYTCCNHNGKCIGKHVRALMLRTGEEPNGRYALHTCHNPRCINGEHLYWGTQKQNIKDMVDAGRFNNERRLSDAEMAELLATYIPYHREFGGTAQSKKYGVCPQTINSLVRNKGYSPK